MKPEVYKIIKTRMPDRGLLERVAPLQIWIEAAKQAGRSPHKRHRTGAVIFDYDGKIITKGCAYPNDGNQKLHSVHAEMDAYSKYMRLPPSKRSDDARCLIVTLTKCYNFASTSKPCSACAGVLTTRMSYVMFAEKTNDGSWGAYAIQPMQLSSLSLPRWREPDQNYTLQKSC